MFTTFNHKHKAERANTVGEEVNSKGSPAVTWLLLCSPKGSMGFPKLHHQQGPCVQKTRARWRGHFSFKPPQFSSWTAMSGQCCEFSESMAISSEFSHSWEHALWGHERASLTELCLFSTTRRCTDGHKAPSREMENWEVHSKLDFSLVPKYWNTSLPLFRKCLISLLWNSLQCNNLSDWTLRGGCLIYFQKLPQGYCSVQGLHWFSVCSLFILGLLKSLLVRKYNQHTSHCPLPSLFLSVPNKCNWVCFCRVSHIKLSVKAIRFFVLSLRPDKDFFQSH